MAKTYKQKRILLQLGPLDSILLDYLVEVSGQNATHVLRQGLRQLARSVPTFDPGVFKKAAKERSKDLYAAAQKKFDEELAAFYKQLDTEDALDRTPTTEYDSSSDFG